MLCAIFSDVIVVKVQRSDRLSEKMTMNASVSCLKTVSLFSLSHFCLWSGETEHAIFKFHSNQHDWINVSQKINPIFLILTMFESYSAMYISTEIYH